ncbi:gluconate 2-dehydrogenase subunit 3 family protein [Paracoccus sp. PAMC 22219]|uniref:gluconate 2-dehydrogenase subunit 3 family protein n=1 Tax=Paracoccus sp. PAMC 22219 TaxID=1569209 RepID=UPI0005A6F2A1|nr:gluconate 2-dehydrogenase subunit 3 family protein [Paracoccus sp. PAMC 22219]
MNRRDLLTMIAAVTGTAMLGAGRVMAYVPTETGQNLFTPEDAAFLDEVAETIIPATDTPGAKDAAAGAFMTQFVSDCYDADEQAAFRDSIETLKAEAQSRYGAAFETLEPAQRQEMLQEAMVAAAAQAVVVNEAKEQARQQARDVQPSADTAASAEADVDLPALHWFTPLQQLTLLGFFTSEIGATQVLRYEPVPGEYIGDLDYDGGPAWAT